MNNPAPDPWSNRREPITAADVAWAVVIAALSTAIALMVAILLVLVPALPAGQ